MKNRTLVVIFQVEAEDVGRPHTIRVVLEDPDGKRAFLVQVAGAEFPTEGLIGNPSVFHLDLDPLTIRSYGSHMFHIYDGDSEIAQVPLLVVRPGAIPQRVRRIGAIQLAGSRKDQTAGP